VTAQEPAASDKAGTAPSEDDPTTKVDRLEPDDVARDEIPAASSEAVR
jgi:hypothetical protein